MFGTPEASPTADAQQLTHQAAFVTFFACDDKTREGTASAWQRKYRRTRHRQPAGSESQNIILDAMRLGSEENPRQVGNEACKVAADVYILSRRP